MSLLKPVYTSEVLSFLGVHDKLFPTGVEHPFLIFALRAFSQPVLMDWRLAQSVSLINQILLSQMAANVFRAFTCLGCRDLRDQWASNRCKPRPLWVGTPRGTSLNIFLYSFLTVVFFFLSLIHPKTTCGCRISLNSKNSGLVDISVEPSQFPVGKHWCDICPDFHPVLILTRGNVHSQTAVKLTAQPEG